jgi:hypothetical protein
MSACDGSNGDKITTPLTAILSDQPHSKTVTAIDRFAPRRLERYSGRGITVSTRHHGCAISIAAISVDPQQNAAIGASLRLIH